MFLDENVINLRKTSVKNAVYFRSSTHRELEEREQDLSSKYERLCPDSVLELAKGKRVFEIFRSLADARRSYAPGSDRSYAQAKQNREADKCDEKNDEEGDHRLPDFLVGEGAKGCA